MTNIHISEEAHTRLLLLSRSVGRPMSALIEEWIAAQEVPDPPSDLPGESWRQVPGYPDYDVSDCGRVRSRKRYPRILKPLAAGNARRYLAVSLDRKRLTIHYLVLLTFVGPRPAGAHICHNNDDAHDNRLVNLRYDTPQANADDSYRRRRHIIMPNGEYA